MMTTHFRDSLVDAGLVTFSTKWIALLRAQTGFQGLLMSDGLLMLKNYADRSILAGGLPPADIAGVDETAVWAARAILAGHDMVIVEGSAAQTTRAFEGLMTIACSGSPTGNALLARIEESYTRITLWKAAHAASLRRSVTVPAAVIQAVIALLPGATARLKTFRFDRGRLARLEPDFVSAEASPEGR
jgi:beta-glucosidase-like glycosyl hydrolase